MSWRALVVALALCGAVSAAQAADQSVPAPAQYGSAYFPQSVYWSGFYVGLNAGGAFASGPYTDPFDGLSTNPTSATVIGGGQFGANWQLDSVVVGFEVDGDGMGVYGTQTDAAGDTHLLRASWLSTLTARVGYAFNTWLFYVKGGFAAGNERDTLVTAAGARFNTSTATPFGWTVGAGIEYGLTHNWSARLEYDFIDLSNSNLTLTGLAGSSPLSVNYTLQRFLLGVNYHL
jgi:opacity protein-like surface antigen